MADKTNPDNLPQADKRKAKKTNADHLKKMENAKAKAARRKANLDAKFKAKCKAFDEKAKWDDSIPAVRFTEGFDKAYEAATTSATGVELLRDPREPITVTVAAPAEVKLADDHANDNVVEETRNGEPPAIEETKDEPATEAPTAEPVPEAVPTEIAEVEPVAEPAPKLADAPSPVEVAEAIVTGPKKLTRSDKRRLAALERDAAKAKKAAAVKSEPTQTVAAEAEAELTPSQQLVKAAKQAMLPSTAPVVGTSAGEAVVYDSTNDHLNKNQADENTPEGHVAEDETPVCDTLVAESEAADAAKKAAEEAEQAAIEKAADDAVVVENPVSDAPAEEAPVVEEQPNNTPESVVETKPEPAQTQSAAEKKPVLATTNPKPTRGAEIVLAAQKFYGSAWNDERAVNLCDAYYWLMKAIDIENEHGTEALLGGKGKMYLHQSLVQEGRAFETKMAMAA